MIRKFILKSLQDAWVIIEFDMMINMEELFIFLAFTLMINMGKISTPK